MLNRTQNERVREIKQTIGDFSKINSQKRYVVGKCVFQKIQNINAKILVKFATKKVIVSVSHPNTVELININKITQRISTKREQYCTMNNAYVYYSIYLLC